MWGVHGHGYRSTRGGCKGRASAVSVKDDFQPQLLLLWTDGAGAPPPASRTRLIILATNLTSVNALSLVLSLP